MGLNDTPYGERIHIGFFGRRNAGKSSLVNAVTGQQMSVVSSVRGTTTDPVYKSMELLPLGPVVVMDTPGFDDEGSLGSLRVRRTKQILNRSDCAVLVIDAAEGPTAWEEELIRLFQEKQLPYLIAFNKSDLLNPEKEIKEMPDQTDISRALRTDAPVLYVSAETDFHIHELKEQIAALLPSESFHKPLVSDLISPGDLILLVIPIDKAAPRGRLILPQQQVLRDILDSGSMALAVRDTELAMTLEKLQSQAGICPSLVITDSQVFGPVSRILPETIPLTSFSILMARYKGFLETAVRGVEAIEMLRDGDPILISEGCTHHRQCGDIGTVKLPALLSRHTGKTFSIHTSSGRDFPEDLSPYRLILHCGGCMLGTKEMLYRQKCAEDAGVPFTNYGIAIAYLTGILNRSLEPLFSRQK